MSKFTIWIDADACPKAVKETVFKASFKRQVPVILVANSYIAVPVSPIIRSIQVDQGADVADFYIVEHLCENDLVVTADIPLAALVVEKGATGINPRGELYDEENVQERLSMRNFMQELRDNGMDSGGPAPYGVKDKERFANTLSKILDQKTR